MKRILFLFVVLVLSSNVYSQTKMFINKTSGVDSVWLTDIKSITFKVYPPIPTQGLVAYYPLNGNANDASGTGNNGTTNGGTTWVADRNGNSNSACSFNGTDAYISVANSPSLQLPTSQLTFALWFKCTGTPQGTVPFFSKNDNTIDFPQYTIQCNPLTDFHFGITDTTKAILWIDTTFNFTFNQWYFIAVAWDGNSTNIFVNDSLVSTQPFKKSMKPDNHQLQIGRDTGGLIDYYQGIMDEIRIYNRALSISEIKMLYSSK